MSFPFFRRSWDHSEELPRSTFSYRPGAFSTVLQPPNQVAHPACSLVSPSCMLAKPLCHDILSAGIPWRTPWAHGKGRGLQAGILSLASVPGALFTS